MSGNIDTDTWDFVCHHLELARDQRDLLDEATSRLKIAPESPLLSCFDKVALSLIDALERMISDPHETLSWWIYECDYGESPKEAGLKSDMRLIEDYGDLRWLIEVQKNG